jgi:hypothetical protein
MFTHFLKPVLECINNLKNIYDIVFIMMSNNLVVYVIDNDSKHSSQVTK